MRALTHRVVQPPSPEALVEQLRGEPGVVLLRSSLLDLSQARYSFVAARPFLSFRSVGSRCETRWAGGGDVRFGDPWRMLDALVSRYELLDEIDLPFPLGGCFGYWGYDLKNFVEPRLPRRAVNDLEFPDCQVGFYDSLVAYDHHLGNAWVLSTGLEPDGSRTEQRAGQQADFWVEQLARGSRREGACEPRPVAVPNQLDSLINTPTHGSAATTESEGNRFKRFPAGILRPSTPMNGGVNETTGAHGTVRSQADVPGSLRAYGKASDLGSQVKAFSNMARQDFVAAAQRAREYIQAGDIYQVNLSNRLTVPLTVPAWEFHQALAAVSPAPFSAYLDAGDFQIASSSPELFLRLTGSRILTRPIKGTRPRSLDPTRDSQLSYQLQTSPKEMAELVMITDLLRNDLGKVCEFGSIQVPELARLERYPQVQHLVSTVEGALRKGVTHLGALASCFPGGSITGAPKIRAMEIIDELESVSRGPYTGALGYLGFNRESQLSIIIRTALCKDNLVHFQVGAGIVADSNPVAEYFETLAKARGFIEALRFCAPQHDRISQRQIRS